MSLKATILKLSLFVWAVLLIPLVSMQFTDEVDWGLGDFLVGGVLLYVIGGVVLWVLRRFSESDYRWFFVIMAVAVFLLIWAELAVGIFH